MKRKALIIDDDALCLDVLTQYLTHKKFDVTSSSRPSCPMIEQELSSCPMQKPCCGTLLSDYHMPGMTGLELFDYQEKRGCKILAKHKALISGAISTTEQSLAENRGYKVFHKPTPLHLLENWLDTFSNQPLAHSKNTYDG